MKFYVKQYKEPISSELKYPCFILVTNAWDDYGFKTMFSLQFYENRHVRTVIGNVKIMDINKDESGGETLLNPYFENLDDNFCSLGTDLNYYQALAELQSTVTTECLNALNDAAYMVGVREEFENTNGFQTSLLRERESKSALLLGQRIINGIPIDSEIKFTFSTKLKNAELPHIVNFEFDENIRRIFAIVGKNGTGKTMFLSNLANALSFIRIKHFVAGRKKVVKINDYETGEFDTKLGPPFGKIIALSYSLFDTYKRPKPSKTFSYIYCGIRNESDEIDKEALIKKHIYSLKQIRRKRQTDIWVDTLEKFVDFEDLGYEFDHFSEITNIDELDLSNILTLSSGHSMLIYTLTELIANLTEGSLVLFDEPENHLHPNAIANLMNSLNELMIKYKSYAILSTHSPIVIQEIPSKNVWIFEREGNTPYNRPLDIESFGENLTVITKHIFDTSEVDEGYKIHLEKLSKRMTYRQILRHFENGLSLNAKLYLSSLYSAIQ